MCMCVCVCERKSLMIGGRMLGVPGTGSSEDASKRVWRRACAKVCRGKVQKNNERRTR